MPEDSPTAASQVQTSNASRSCDACRLKKVRCRVEESPQGAKCKRCITFKIDCTYASARKRKASTTTRVQQLERRQQILQTLLKQFLPDVDLSGDFDVHEVATSMSPPEAWVLELLRYCRTTSEDWVLQGDLGNETHAEVDTISAHPRRRYYGDSSSQEIIMKFVFAWKQQRQNTLGRGESLWQHGLRTDNFAPTVPPWEQQLHSPCRRVLDPTSFPEQDLMNSLLNLYFDHVNLFMPLLHRPTFNAGLIVDMHLVDTSFARVVLLVCAIGARFSEDPRVLCTGSQSPLSAGWKWYNQAQSLEETLLAPASLYNIQSCCLSAEFLRGAGATSVFWTTVGIGLRRAQDVGAHRWRTFGEKKSVDRELWTRAWWCLIVMDRMASAATGQTNSASWGCEFDVGFPTECDDEFWDHLDPHQSWRQPESVPSKISFFISHIKQTAILASALEYQYANHKTKSLYLMDQYRDLDRKVVMELDSTVNKWVDSIPEHLRNPQAQRNSVFHRQSIVLHAELYALRILMHRPFLSSTDKQSTLSSIAICTNAAKACSRLFDPHSISSQNVVHRLQWPIFSATVVLLLSVWSSKRLCSEGPSSRQMQNVENCIAMLRHSERRWQSSGQLVDMIQSLVSASDLSLLPVPSLTSLHSSMNPLDLSFSDGSMFVSSTGHSPLSSSNSGGPLYHPCSDVPLPSNLMPDSVTTSPWSFNNAYAAETTTLPSLPQDSIHQPLAQPDGLPYYNLSESFGLDPGLIPDTLDVDTLDLWTKTPLGINIGEWQTYVDTVNEVSMSSSMSHMQFP